APCTPQQSRFIKERVRFARRLTQTLKAGCSIVKRLSPKKRMRLICPQTTALITLALIVLGSDFACCPGCEYGTGQSVRDGVLSTPGPGGGTNFRDAAIFRYSGFNRAGTASTMKIAAPLAPDHKTRFGFHFASSDCYGPISSG